MTADMNQQCIQSHSNCHSLSYTEQLKPSFILFNSGMQTITQFAIPVAIEMDSNAVQSERKIKDQLYTTYIKVVTAYWGAATQMMPIKTKYGRNCK